MTREISIKINKKKFNQLVKASKQALHSLELENIDHKYLTYVNELPIKSEIVVIDDLKIALKNLSK
jgi:hypothetical protein